MSADVPDYLIWDRLARCRAEELTLLQSLAAKLWPPSMQITVAPESRTVNAGEQAKINYALVNADLIKVTSKVEGDPNVNEIDLATLSQPGGSLTIAPSKTVEYTFLVGGAGGCYSETVKITVNAVAPPPQPPAVIGSYFDFGTPTSAVMAGYVGVSELTKYSAAQGYGFTALLGSVGSRDRGATAGGKPVDEIKRDFVFADDMTFRLDLPNGDYNLTVTVGDSVYLHGPMNLYLQDMTAVVDSLSYTVGTWTVKTYPVKVVDGALHVRLENLAKPAASPHAIINALDIVPVLPVS